MLLVQQHAFTDKWNMALFFLLFIYLGLFSHLVNKL